MQDLPLTVIPRMLGQAMTHLADICLAEGTLLLFSAHIAVTKVALAIFVSETLSTFVGAGEFAHVEHVTDLARDLHFFELRLA